VTEYIYDMENDAEITAEEAASMLGVTPTQVRWYYRHGLLSARRIGARLLVFRRDEVANFEKPKKSGRPKTSQAPAPKAKRGKKNGRPKRSAFDGK